MAIFQTREPAVRERLETDVKICGLSDPVCVAQAIAGGVSHIGFIFFERSPRNVSAKLARELSDDVPDHVKRVAVSVNADNEVLDDIVETVRPHMLQLHGSESPQKVGEIKRRFGLPVMKALAIQEQQDFSRADEYIGIADRLLFDAKPPKGSQLPGGNGVSFDWDLFSYWQDAHMANNHLDSCLSPMLSGGVNLDNIVTALGSSKARAIDISSGVEKAPGVKDPELIRHFLRCVKEFENDRKSSDSKS